MVRPAAPPAPGARCGNVYLQYYKFERALARLKVDGALPFEQLPHRVRGTGSDGWEELAKRDWLDRLDGGLGCWHSEPSSESSTVP